MLSNAGAPAEMPSKCEGYGYMEAKSWPLTRGDFHFNARFPFTCDRSIDIRFR